MSVNRPVVVMQLPEQLNLENSENFLLELTCILESHRPRIVLDCALVRSIDGAGVEMLLHCLEEAMKRDGDVKLCAVSREADVMLELMRVDRVFEVFATSDEAVRSFSGISSDAVPQDAPWYSNVVGDLGFVKQAS